MRGEGRIQYSWESYQQNITAAFKALSQVQPIEEGCSAVDNRTTVQSSALQITAGQSCKDVDNNIVK